MSYRTNRRTKNRFPLGTLNLADPYIRHQIRTGARRESMTIEELDKTRPDLTLITNSQEVEQTLKDEGFGDEIDDWGGLLVSQREGEITEIWAYSGTVPDYGKIAVRLK